MKAWRTLLPELHPYLPQSSNTREQQITLRDKPQQPVALPIRTRYSPSYRPAALPLTKPHSPQEQNWVAKWQRGDRKGRAGPGEPWVDRHHCKQTNSRLWQPSDPEKHLAIRVPGRPPAQGRAQGKYLDHCQPNRLS